MGDRLFGTRIKREASEGSLGEGAEAGCSTFSVRCPPLAADLCAAVELHGKEPQEEEPLPPPAPAASPQPSVSLQLEQAIQMNLRSDLAQAQQHTIQNQTSIMLALGANLVNQTMAQTHKLAAMEAQVTGEPSESQADPPGSLSFPVTVLGRSGPEAPWPPRSLTCVHITRHLPLHCCTASDAFV